MFSKMEFNSEIDALVGLSKTHCGEPVQTSWSSGHEMALKRFHFEFPTPESQEAYVDIFLKWTPESELEDLNDERRVKAAFKYWFQVIWPNLPRLRTMPQYLAFQRSETVPTFSVGQVVEHLRFGYRGVIVAIDRRFKGTDEWYQQMAPSRPAKNRPWYRVLVDDSDQMTYVAERHLQLDECPEPISHPLISRFFEGFDRGRYYFANRKRPD